MIIYPAIDLRGGQVVRLREGDPSQQTVFSRAPAETARRWIAAGASWLHMVNLDGAFAAANDNGAILAQVAALNVKVQFGGGLRSLEDIAVAFDRGARRVVLGTVALTTPEIVGQAVERWGTDAICVALDARDGQITTHGWQQTAAITPVELGIKLAERGVRHALYTDVSRDGQMTGVNLDATIALAQATGLQVIASGGVSTLDDIRQLAASRA
ncbi:MAG: 1-(5-phosphoribosyl)-5-((5-phosphoribosylamino)methylideneamino)imidazole-4-carboxamide isomerase, partial [Chloroflexi bacterium]|nr:1-(5-phosphoribosyl)-5-((5-phosphoribosylamino)methylideneamino)imidazole-4-carboxamide isomerase [Chloroflexota bacterium]